MNKEKVQIKTWRDFDRHVRWKGINMLERLDDFPNSIVITGCQRSGTSILFSIVNESEDIESDFGYEDEFEVALILSGFKEYHASGRQCFQTTYLNERCVEHFVHRKGHKIVWVIRNPYSVVCSMIYNWDKAALHTLFLGCGRHLLEKKPRFGESVFLKFAVDDLNKACLSYVGKIEQAFEMKKQLSESEIIFIDYDQLVSKKNEILENLFKFLGLTYKEEYGNRLNTKSIKKSDKLSNNEKGKIEKICEPIYKVALNNLILNV